MSRREPGSVKAEHSQYDSSSCVNSNVDDSGNVQLDHATGHAGSLVPLANFMNTPLIDVARTMRSGACKIPWFLLFSIDIVTALVSVHASIGAAEQSQDFETVAGALLVCLACCLWSTLLVSFVWVFILIKSKMPGVGLGIMFILLVVAHWYSFLIVSEIHILF